MSRHILVWAFAKEPIAAFLLAICLRCFSSERSIAGAVDQMTIAIWIVLPICASVCVAVFGWYLTVRSNQLSEYLEWTDAIGIYDKTISAALAISILAVVAMAILLYTQIPGRGTGVVVVSIWTLLNTWTCAKTGLEVAKLRLKFEGIMRHIESTDRVE